MDKAYATIEFKAVGDGDDRTLEGIASTPTPDRDEDIMEPLGAKYKLPLPLLWHHKGSEPIGLIHTLEATKGGIRIKAKIAKAGVTAEIDKAWALIKEGLVRGLSIGFRGTKTANIENSRYGRHFLEWDLFEVSAVTIPANAEASITAIKQLDTEYQSAALREYSAKAVKVLQDNTPGATGKPNPKGTSVSKKSLSEHIQDLVNKRAAIEAQRLEIVQKTADEGRTMDEKERESYDTLAADIKAIDDDLVRLKDFEKSQLEVSTAVTTEAGTSENESLKARGGNIVAASGAALAAAYGTGVRVKTNVEKGTAWTRYVCALAVAKGNRWEAFHFAEQNKHWRDTTPEVANILKAAVAAGTTTDTTWAAPLVDYQTMAGEFIELLRPATIIGRIPGLRRVPFNIRMASQTSGSTQYWVGEGAPKPVSKLGFSEVTLRWAKAAGIVVLTEELVRAANPSAEAVVRADMIAQNAQFLDEQFIHPGVGEVANVSPGSITAGITPVTATGTTAAAFRTDMQTLLSSFITSNLDVSDLVMIMSSVSAMRFSFMMNALDQREFPDVSMNGGNIGGIPVITSQSANVSGSPTYGNLIIVLKPSEIMLADDGQVIIDASREASLQMLDNPTNSPTGGTTATSMVSMFQTNSVAIRAERFINWKRRRDAAVAWINNTAYVG